MQKLVRLGPVQRGWARTVEKQGDQIEVMDSVPVGISSWKSERSSQRWLAVFVNGGEHNGLELYIPLEAFAGEDGSVVDPRQLSLIE